MMLLKKILFNLYLFFRKNYYGFVLGHIGYSNAELHAIKDLIPSSQGLHVASFEKNFAKLIGEGYVTSYAAARMGFYSILQAIEAKEGDEVILPAFTCSVMVNAVLRMGCKPIFTDIDPQTYGSSADAIKACITKKTKAIVAQHSFGIPCDIEEIVKITREHQIFLIEDCAISLGSKVGSICVGNFGDAAIFSTDHSKPINTMTGGIVYTTSKIFHNKLIKLSLKNHELSLELKRLIFKKIIIEKFFFRKGKYRYYQSYIWLRKLLLKNSKLEFFENDFKSKVNYEQNYPLKFPEFLAYIGNIELIKWNEVSEKRKLNLKDFINQFSGLSDIYLPLAYFKKNYQIVPFRFVFECVDKRITSEVFKKFIDINWIWFKKPIIATVEPIINFGYAYGSCPRAESLGNAIINLPPYFDGENFKFLISEIKNVERNDKCTI